MKRFLAIAMLIVLCLSFAACGQTEGAKNADAMIAALGEITLASGDALEDAQAAVSVLSEKEQESLQNLSLLKQAQLTYDGLVDDHLAPVEQAISAIGTVSVDSADAVAAARSMFDGLEAKFQGLVENAADLTAAETALAACQVAHAEETINAIGEVTLESGLLIENARTVYNGYSAAVQEAVSNVDVLVTAEDAYSALCVQNAIDLIDAIGKVKLESEENILAAETAYNALSEEEKALVTNATELADAKTKLADLKQAQAEKERKKLLKNFRTEYDKIQGITWYYHKTYPKYIDSRCYLLPYIGQYNAGGKWLRLVINYTGDDWVFWENLTIMVDGKKYYKFYSYYTVERDNAHGDVWEYVDFAPTEEDLEMLRAIAASSEAIIRFQGDTYYHDYTIPAKDKTAITEILKLYDQL